MNSVEQYIFQQNMAQLDTHWEPFAKEIMALQTPDTFTCLYATDIHYIRKYAYYAVVYSRLQEMVAFSGHIGADLLAVTGDLADGNTTLTRQYRDLYDVVSLLRQSKTTFLALSKGNHDNCGWYSYQHELGVDNLITPEQWYTHVVNPVRVQFAIRCDAANPGGGYYAMDDPFHKIRILNLDSSDLPVVTDENGLLPKQWCGHWTFGFRQAQLRWLAEMLRLPEPGWGVMLLSHCCPLTENEEPVLNGDLVKQLLRAFQNGEKGTLTGDLPHMEAEAPYDFTQNQSRELLPWFYGHVHRDDVQVRDGVTLVSTRNLLGKVPAPDSWDRGEDSTALFNGSWDCILLDRKRRHVTIRRFDRPAENRSFDY